LLQLTDFAELRLADLSAVDLDELTRIKPMLAEILARYS
jgi:hypothetical protein